MAWTPGSVVLAGCGAPCARAFSDIFLVAWVAESFFARFAGACHAIVDVSITIIVESIAKLGSGCLLVEAIAPELISFAVLDACFALALCVGAFLATITLSFGS